MIERSQVVAAIKALLDRAPASEESLTRWMQSESIDSLIRSLTSGEEFVERMRRKVLDSAADKGPAGSFESLVGLHNDNYLSPTELRRSQPEPSKILLIGQCLLASWGDVLKGMPLNSAADHILFNNFANIPDQPPGDVGSYLFQVVQVPVRSTIPDHDILKLDHTDLEACKALLAKLCGRLPMFVDNIMKYNTRHGLLTFFCNFLLPQANLMGRLLPRYDERNTLYFYEKLNEALYQAFAKYKNCHLLDVNNISNVLGKRFSQDDAVWLTSHGGILVDFDFPRDRERIEPPAPMSEHYRSDWRGFIEAALNEAFAMHKTITQQDSVKLVVTDLDDTMWRGVIGDAGVEPIDVEGWPLGYAEALTYLRRRGVLLGIVSKNTEAIVTKGWGKATGGRIGLEDFAIKRINWKTKVENMADILSVVNLLPRNVVYVDDNPVERAAMQAAYPQMRVTGAHPYFLKRILLWSPETQVATVTAESAKRTEMIQAQAARESVRQAMPREDFLATLNLKVSIENVESAASPRFARCFELINKTNQFNTTGQRWTHPMCDAHFTEGGRFVAFFVKDTYTDYGLVGVLIVKQARLLQFVMSCRVVGLDVERAVMAWLMGDLKRRGYGTCTASFVKTDANGLCGELYAGLGFTQQEALWMLSLGAPLSLPVHIGMDAAQPAAA